jgi:hypothetical protein
MRKAIVLVAGLSAVGLSIHCGKGSPAAPTVAVTTTTTTTTTVPGVSQIRDGVTGALLGASAQPNGAMVTVSAPGYLTRIQPAANTVYLWPHAEAYVEQLVYRGSSPTSGLYRWPAGMTVRAAFVAGLGAYDSYLADAVAEMRAVTRFNFVALPAGSQAEVLLNVDSSQVPDDAIAVTTFNATAWRITGARVFFEGPSNIIGGGGFRNNTLLHEMGHVMGLAHSGDRRDVMSVENNRRADKSYGPDESKALAMVYSWRKAGNTFPDSEAAGLPAASTGSISFACR